MNIVDTRRHLLALSNPLETITFLQDVFLPEIVDKLNEVGTRRRIALYGGERIPENERNLTDVRNRMSLLLEYKLAWIANDILAELPLEDVFWTNVVANRFPDLEVRNTQGERGVRIEVKCLEAIAEEKSANFDTLKKDLNPNTDFLVVFIWEWFRDEAAVTWDRAPKILKSYVFHASTLATLRDRNWLNKPPADLGNGYQGFDIRYAVTCRAGVYSEEEGNYGKLLRIWNTEENYATEDPLTQKCIQDFSEFEDFVVWSGFEVLSQYMLCQLEDNNFSEMQLEEGQVCGYKNGHIGFVFKRRISSIASLYTYALNQKLARLIVFTDKYQWSDHILEAGSFSRSAEGKKPKHLLNHLDGN